MVAINTFSEELRRAGGKDQRALAEILRAQSSESLVRRPTASFTPRKSSTNSPAVDVPQRITALENWAKMFGKEPLSGAMLARLSTTGTGVLFEPIVIVGGEQRALGCLTEGLRVFEVASRSGEFKLCSLFSRYRLGAVIQALAMREIEPEWLNRQMKELLQITHI